MLNNLKNENKNRIIHDNISNKKLLNSCPSKNNFKNSQIISSSFRRPEEISFNQGNNIPECDQLKKTVANSI